MLKLNQQTAVIFGAVSSKFQNAYLVTVEYVHILT